MAGTCINCYVCRDVELIWNSDHVKENEDGIDEIETLLTCPKCEAEHFVYHSPQARYPDWLNAVAAMSDEEFDKLNKRN